MFRLLNRSLVSKSLLEAAEDAEKYKAKVSSLNLSLAELLYKFLSCEDWCQTVRKGKGRNFHITLYVPHSPFRSL